jgi:hypothetical protein
LLEEEPLLVDLSGTPLEVIAHLLEPSTGDMDADGGVEAMDRPALRRAVLRVRSESERPGELFAGFQSHLL